MTELEKAALNFTRYTEIKRKFQEVLDKTLARDEELLNRRLQHRVDLQNEIDEAYGIMLTHLAEQDAKTVEALAEMSQMSQKLGLYD